MSIISISVSFKICDIKDRLTNFPPYLHAFPCALFSILSVSWRKALFIPKILQLMMQTQDGQWQEGLMSALRIIRSSADEGLDLGAKNRAFLWRILKCIGCIGQVENQKSSHLNDCFHSVYVVHPRNVQKFSIYWVFCNVFTVRKIFE